MRAEERRKKIFTLLLNKDKPLKGSDIALHFNVTRQVIVKDIAILRAQQKHIIATPEGYIINKKIENRVKEIIAVCHNKIEMKSELETVVKYGGIIEDVIVDHPLYGEIKGMLMIKNYNDLKNFIKSFSNTEANPLSALTNGVHLHTISADTNENMELIKIELKEKGFLL